MIYNSLRAINVEVGPVKVPVIYRKFVNQWGKSYYMVYRNGLGRKAFKSVSELQVFAQAYLTRERVRRMRAL
jgi:hypothetical protein